MSNQFDPRTIGLAAGPFRRLPSLDTIQRMSSAAQALRQTQIQQAQPATQASSGVAYRWATLNVPAIIGGHTFQAGARIVVAPSLTQTSGGGKAHTTSTVVKVWAKFGQTFDSSSWVEGSLPVNAFTYTGQSATWSSSSGFGAIDGAGVGFTPEEASAIQHQINEAVLVASDRAGLQGKQAAEKALWTAAIAAGIGGGLLGAGTLYFFTRR